MADLRGEGNIGLGIQWDNLSKNQQPNEESSRKRARKPARKIPVLRRGKSKMGKQETMITKEQEKSDQLQSQPQIMLPQQDKRATPDQ